MAISDQTGNDIDEAVGGTAVTGMLNLRDVFELIHDAFNDGTFPQKQLVHQGYQAIFHVLSQFSDELDTEGIQKLLEQCLRNVATICDQLAKQASG
jgi:hypothetical protein